MCYNLQILNECIHGEKIYICEGITDTLTMLENGYKAVGIMGSNNFKKEYIEYLSKYASGTIQFNSPKPIDIELNEKSFNSLFDKFVGKEVESRIRNFCGIQCHTGHPHQ